MAEENVEIAQRMSDAFNARDFEGMFETLAPDVEWIPIMAVLEGRVYRGHAGVRRWIEDLGTYWEIFETHQEEYRPVGNRVLVLGHWHARAKESRVELEGEQASWVLDFEDAKITRLQTYTDRAEAFQAVGLKQ
jgi:ketosteroid isomerase-like protein